MKTSSLELLEKTQLPPAQARAILQVMEGELTSREESLATRADLRDGLHGLELKSEALRTEMQALRGDTRTEMQTQGGGLRTEMQILDGELRTEMEALRGELRTEMKTLGGELRTEMKTLGGELRTEMKTLSGELRTEMQTQRAELIREIKGTVRWNFAFWVAQLAALVGVIKLMK